MQANIRIGVFGTWRGAAYMKTLRMVDGSEELVYDTTDAYGNPDLGINASNEEYLERHPYASREDYSLCNFDMSEVEIVDQMELPGMSMGGM